ncbi:MAG: hypothetical protein A2516_05145 [Alphaproteobacteria bacterium RIFOXYD12_FULL_60_8]|nr:MAG: hypothetical protein A2516_05145 [Alphaproteobacteria bacterium RIFOXYD12_FULL_60_8]
MHLKLFTLSFAIFVLNDIAWLSQPSYVTFTLLDWSFRLIVVGFLFSFAEMRHMADCGFRYQMRLRGLFRHVLLPALGAMLIVGVADAYAFTYPILHFFSPPAPTSLVLHLWDVSLGLFLVGLSETLVFILLPIRLQRETGWPMAWIVVGACLAFGLAHWSKGLFPMISSGLVNGVFFWIAFRTRSMGAVILVHYSVDFYFLALRPFLEGQTISAG